MHREGASAVVARVLIFRYNCFEVILQPFFSLVLTEPYSHHKDERYRAGSLLSSDAPYNANLHPLYPLSNHCYWCFIRNVTQMVSSFFSLSAARPREQLRPGCGSALSCSSFAHAYKQYQAVIELRCGCIVGCITKCTYINLLFPLLKGQYSTDNGVHE